MVRERCGWCGALIYEADIAQVAVPTADLKPGQTVEDLFIAEDGTPRAHWRGLVWVMEGPAGSHVMARATYDVDEQENIPENSCMNIDPEMTR